MIQVTAKDLMKAQKKIHKSRKMQEDEMKVSEETKQKFQRKPYYMLVGKKQGGGQA